MGPSLSIQALKHLCLPIVDGYILKLKDRISVFEQLWVSINFNFNWGRTMDLGCKENSGYYSQIMTPMNFAITNIFVK